MGPYERNAEKQASNACVRCYLEHKCDGAGPPDRCDADNTISAFRGRGTSPDGFCLRAYVDTLEQRPWQLVANLQERYTRTPYTSRIPNTWTYLENLPDELAAFYPAHETFRERQYRAIIAFLKEQRAQKQSGTSIGPPDAGVERLARSILGSEGPDGPNAMIQKVYREHGRMLKTVGHLTNVAMLHQHSNAKLDPNDVIEMGIPGENYREGVLLDQMLLSCLTVEAVENEPEGPSPPRTRARTLTVQYEDWCEVKRRNRSVRQSHSGHKSCSWCSSRSVFPSPLRKVISPEPAVIPIYNAIATPTVSFGIISTVLRRYRMSGLKMVSLCVLAMSIVFPCAAALLIGSNFPGDKRVIAGVLSSSASVALVPLQTEEDYAALRTMLRILWGTTYGAFLTYAYKRLTRLRERDGSIYLFCALLLAAHFIFGFAGSADTTEEATKGILMFGPLVATLCAALVYIPFSHRSVDGRNATENPEAALTNNETDRARQLILSQNSEATSNDLSGAGSTHQSHDESGDLGIVQRVAGAVMGWVM